MSGERRRERFEDWKRKDLKRNKKSEVRNQKIEVCQSLNKVDRFVNKSIYKHRANMSLREVLH